MTAPQWAFASERGQWSLELGGVDIASSGSQKHALGTAIRRLVADYDDLAIEVERLTRDLAEERAACAKLAAWAETVKGRTGETP